MRKPYYWIAFAIVCLISCQQELTEFIPELQQRCKIMTGYYYGGSGGINDSMSFTYNGDKVIRADANYNYILYSYTNERISGRKFYDNISTELVQVDSIGYDGSGKITSMISWYYADPFFGDTTRVKYQIQYASGKLSKVTETYILFSSFGTEYDTLISLFQANAAGNLEKLSIADAQELVYDSVTYSFDNNPNFFSAAHPDFFLLDPYFQLQVGLTSHFPYIYSRNNVTQFHLYGTADYDIQYGLDSLNNVSSVDMDGFDYIKYRYQCE